MSGDAVGLAFVHRERERTLAAATCGVLTGRFADHAIRLAGLLRQPGDVGLGFVPVHAHRRLARAQRIARLARLALTSWTGVTVRHFVTGAFDVGVPFAAQHLKAADGEGLGKGHIVHRAFVRLATQFLFRRAHGKGARRQHDHLGAILAVLEDFAGLGCGRLSGAAQGQAEQRGQGQGEQHLFHDGPQWQKRKAGDAEQLCRRQVRWLSSAMKRSTSASLFNRPGAVRTTGPTSRLTASTTMRFFISHAATSSLA